MRSMRTATECAAAVGIAVAYVMGCTGDSESSRKDALNDAMVAGGHAGGGASGRDAGRGSGGEAETGGASATGGSAAGGSSTNGGTDGGGPDVSEGGPAGGGTSRDGATDGGADSSTDGGGAVSDYRSGTRLRAMVYAIPGVRVWHGWFDEDLGVECAFVRAEDGKIRCLPTTPANRFATSVCSKDPVGYVNDGGCALPKFVSGVTDDCGTTAAYTLGAATTISKAFPLNPYPNSRYCMLQKTGDEQGYALVKRPDSDFVAATVVVENRTADLGVSYYQTDDGARQPVGAYDLMRAHACDPAGVDPLYHSAPAFDHVCAPTPRAAAGTLFSDNACTHMVGAIDKCLGSQVGAVEVTTVTVSPLGDPTTDVSLANVGPPASVASLFSSGQACTPVTDTSTPYWQSRDYFTVGSTIAPSELPVVGTADFGSDRVKARYYASSDGKPLTFIGFYDTTLALRCSAILTDDAGVRCFPDDTIDTLYTDDKCTVPIGINYAGSGGYPTYEVSGKYPACGPPTHALWRTGSTPDPVLPTLYMNRLDTGCAKWVWVPSGSPATIALSVVPSATLGSIQDFIE